MSAVTNMWRQLVQRRLWPAAILLIAALVAVPLTLAKEPEPATAPPPAAAPSDDELAVAPIVAVADTTDRARRRRVLGAAKNPFVVVKPDKPAPITTSAPKVSQATAGDEAAPSTGTSVSPSLGASVAPSEPVAPEPEPAPEKRFERQELTVRFGGADGVERMSVKRLEPLPSSDAPVLVYLGTVKDGKVAEFLVSQGVAAAGDGECLPTAEACETIRLRAGETEFLDVIGEDGTVAAQYQLDLVKIHRGGSASAAKASKASGRSLRARVARSVAGRLP